MKLLTKKEEDLVFKQIDKAQENDGKMFGLSYEQGIIDALNWIINGDLEEPLYD